MPYRRLPRMLFAGLAALLTTVYGPPASARAQELPAGVRSLAAAVVAANDCAGAPAIGNGTFTGTTSGATNDGAATCGLSDFTADVWFRYVAPAGGTISVDTFGSAFDTVLSVRTGCPGTGSELRCNDDVAGLQSALTFNVQAGVSYWIRVSGADGATGGFTLRVGTGGSVSGRVTTAGSGAPVTSGKVLVSDRFRFTVQSAPLAADGSYTVSGLAASGYRLHTETEQGVRDEVWNDHPCASGPLCETAVGDSVVVGSLGTTSGIDFVLDPGGVIAGTVRREANGDPIEGVRLEAWQWQPPAEPRFATATVSLADGTYALGGLGTGSYLVTTFSPEWEDELYDDVMCPGGQLVFFPSCDPAGGAPVAVTVGATTGGIDFDLARLGILEGTVTDATTGDPIENVRVEVHAERGGFLGSVFTDSSGTYRIAGLLPGTHFLSSETSDYLTEVYLEIDCPGFCRPTDVGTPVPLALDQIVGGLDFTLERLGSISGSVTDAGTGDPVFEGRVQVFGGTGTFVEDTSVSAGAYQVSDLPAGSYFVRVLPFFSSVHLGELYDDLPCFAGCDPTVGTLVTVLPGADTPGIDFALDRGGTITGTITDSVTGSPIASRGVQVYDETGSLRVSTSTSGTGVYRAEGLLPGDHFVLTSSFSHVDRLYDGVPCFEGLRSGCDLRDGTPIPVTANSTIAGIDFVLDPLGSISGRVSDAVTGDGLEDGDAQIFDSTGSQVDSRSLGTNGEYTFDRLPPGDYFVRAESSGFLAGLFDGFLCHPFCDVTAGTPVTVAPGATIEGIDLQLERGTRITGRVVSALTGEPIAGANVHFQSADGSSSGTGFTDGEGNYQTPGLSPGTYLLLASASSFIPEVYDDILCAELDFFGFQCDVNKGTPVEVTLAGDTSGIDFALEPFNAGLTGTVLDQATGRPLAGIRVRIWDSTGSPILQVTTRHDGVWLADLPPGTYFVSTDAGPEILDQVYDGVICGASCDPLSGTPVTVPGSFSVVRGIDFILENIAAIFSDGFESGDVSTWTRRVPEVP